MQCERFINITSLLTELKWHGGNVYVSSSSSSSSLLLFWLHYVILTRLQTASDVNNRKTYINNVNIHSNKLNLQTLVLYQEVAWRQHQWLTQSLIQGLLTWKHVSANLSEKQLWSDAFLMSPISQVDLSGNKPGWSKSTALYVTTQQRPLLWYINNVSSPHLIEKPAPVDRPVSRSINANFRQTRRGPWGRHISYLIPITFISSASCKCSRHWII